MSAFSSPDFAAGRYDDARPNYPDSWYTYLHQYHNTHTHPSTSLDIGCGPGTATFQLSRHFPELTSVTGADLSSTMIKRAELLNATVHKDPRVSFRTGSYDEYPAGTPPTYGLITAVECAHWFDFDRFQQSAAEHLAPGGTIAIWGYIDPVVEGYPDIDVLTAQLLNGDEALGPYWQQPGRHILRGMLGNAHLDPQLFTDIEEAQFEAGAHSSSAERDAWTLLITRSTTLRGFEAYLATCSAYHSWQKDSGNSGKPDPIAAMLQEVKNRHPELARDTPIQVTWNSFYKLGKRVETPSAH